MLKAGALTKQEMKEGNPNVLVEQFNPLPSEKIQEKMNFFFMPYNPELSFCRHMEFKQDHAQDKLNMLMKVLCKSGNELSAQDKQAIKKRIQAILNNQDESQKSKWVYICNFIYQFDSKHRRHLMEYFWKMQGGKEVKKEKMKQFKKKIIDQHMMMVKKTLNIKENQSSPKELKLDHKRITEITKRVVHQTWSPNTKSKNLKKDTNPQSNEQKRRIEVIHEPISVSATSSSNSLSGSSSVSQVDSKNFNQIVTLDPVTLKKQRQSARMFVFDKKLLEIEGLS